MTPHTAVGMGGLIERFGGETPVTSRQPCTTPSTTWAATVVDTIGRRTGRALIEAILH